MKRIKNLKLKIKNFSKGFTLVELLIVIAIIGVLSALLMANFIGVRQRARDAQRKADLRQIQSALELYRSDNGSYPIGNYAALSNCTGKLGNPACTTTYMQKLPADPLGGTATYYYNSAAGTTYTIRACLENSADKDIDTSTNNCGKNNDFRLYNP